MLNTKRLVICCSFWTISNTNINIYRSERSHSLTSVKRKDNPPVCTCDNSRRSRFQEVQRSRLKTTAVGMIVLITLLILREKTFSHFE